MSHHLEWGVGDADTEWGKASEMCLVPTAESRFPGQQVVESMMGSSMIQWGKK